MKIQIDKLTKSFKVINTSATIKKCSVSAFKNKISETKTSLPLAAMLDDNDLAWTGQSRPTDFKRRCDDLLRNQCNKKLNPTLRPKTNKPSDTSVPANFMETEDLGHVPNQTNLQYQIPVSNKFGALIQLNNTEEAAENQPHTATSTITKKRMPPIIVTERITDFQKFNNEIRNITEDYTVRYLTKSINIYTYNKTDFHKVQEELRKENVSHHTFTPRDEKPNKIILKAAPNMVLEELKTNLESHNINVTSCKQLISKKTGQPSPSYLIYTDKATTLANVKSIKKIGNIQTKWENYAKDAEVSQCYRCQSFHHGSSNCGNAPRCVKCINPHLTKDCQIIKTATSTPQCCNCLGPHTANYKGCPMRPRKTKQGHSNINDYQTGEKNHFVQPKPDRATNFNTNAKANNFPPLNKNNNDNAPNPLKHNPKQSYANITKNSEINPQSNLNEFNQLINELNDLNEICNIKKLLNLVLTLKRELINCKSPLEKLVVLQNLSESL